MEPDDRHARIRSSWDANAAAWTEVVRNDSIPSRRAGTSAAILEACLQSQPQRVLDVGCGEGWLARKLAEQGVEVIGIDAAPALIEVARDAGGATYAVVDYDALIQDSSAVPGPFDTIVCNYSLFGDPLAPLLSALASRLVPTGRLQIQTVHPWVIAGDGPYECGWREEDYATFAAEFPAPMPWYFRTLESWLAEFQAADLVLEHVREPTDRGAGRPLSLVFSCRRSA
jgi:2-polyprenyl-3-methyl-5-hydroxy-6-metoxy-1,4-benzoquinol methylase